MPYVEAQTLDLRTERTDTINLTLVVARSSNFVIGSNGDMPWHIPEDLQHFQKVTKKKIVIMGRKTHESIGCPLPDRWNLIISRNPDYKAQGCAVFGSIEEALVFARDSREALRLNGYSDEICLIGGGELYREGIKYANKMYLTEINVAVAGDTFFEFATPEWKIVDSTSPRPAWDTDYLIRTLERVGPIAQLPDE